MKTNPLYLIRILKYLEEHVRRASLHLGGEDGEPQLLCRDRAAELLLLLVLFIEGFELVTPDIGKTFRLR